MEKKNLNKNYQIFKILNYNIMIMIIIFQCIQNHVHFLYLMYKYKH